MVEVIMSETGEASKNNHLALTSDIVAAYLSNNHVAAAEVAALIAQVHSALANLGRAGATEDPAVAKVTPAEIKKSITHDALISFEDGKPYKTLKRHLTGRGL